MLGQNALTIQKRIFVQYVMISSWLVLMQPVLGIQGVKGVCLLELLTYMLCPFMVDDKDDPEHIYEAFLVSVVFPNLLAQNTLHSSHCQQLQLQRNKCLLVYPLLTAGISKIGTTMAHSNIGSVGRVVVGRNFLHKSISLSDHMSSFHHEDKVLVDRGGNDMSEGVNGINRATVHTCNSFNKYQ